MSGNRLTDYLDHMRQAAMDACSFVEGMGKDDFLEDKRTQQAVIMSLIIIGEAATKVMDGYTEFTQRHPEVPWRGMCNRIAHGYFRVGNRAAVQAHTVLDKAQEGLTLRSGKCRI